MGFFNKYPYTNEHELNLDWIIAKINALKDRVKAVEDAIHDIVVEMPNDGKLTIKRNNIIVGDFTANQATDEDINIAVPENTSDLNNDSGFITSSDLPDMNNYYDKTETDTLLNAKADTSSLATVATSGRYNDLIDQPTIPAAQVNSDWNALSGVAEILNKPNTLSGYGITDAYTTTQVDNIINSITPNTLTFTETTSAQGAFYVGSLTNLNSIILQIYSTENYAYLLRPGVGGAWVAYCLDANINPVANVEVHVTAKYLSIT